MAIFQRLIIQSWVVLSTTNDAVALHFDQIQPIAEFLNSCIGRCPRFFQN